MKEKLPPYMGADSIQKGGLHKSLGIPLGTPIPEKKIKGAEKKGGKVAKQAVLAENFKHMNHTGKKPIFKANTKAPHLG